MTDVRLTALRSALTDRSADYRAVVARSNEDRQAFIAAEDTQVEAETAQQVINLSALRVQQVTHVKIANLVTRCLAAIFDDPYSFELHFRQNRGRTEATIKLLKDGFERDDPLSQVGGGVNDVAAFALRLSALVLQRPPLRRVMVLDEPFRGLRGKVYRERVRGLLQSLAAELGVQLVVCCDHESYPQFLMGRVVEIG